MRRLRNLALPRRDPLLPNWVCFLLALEPCAATDGQPGQTTVACPLVSTDFGDPHATGPFLEPRSHENPDTPRMGLCPCRRQAPCRQVCQWPPESDCRAFGLLLRPARLGDRRSSARGRAAGWAAAASAITTRDHQRK